MAGFLFLRVSSWVCRILPASCLLQRCRGCNHRENGGRIKQCAGIKWGFSEAATGEVNDDCW